MLRFHPLLDMAVPSQQHSDGGSVSHNFILFSGFVNYCVVHMSWQEYKRKQLEEQRQAERLQRQLQQERDYLVSLQQQQRQEQRPTEKKPLYHYKEGMNATEKPAWAKEVGLITFYLGVGIYKPVSSKLNLHTFSASCPHPELFGITWHYFFIILSYLGQ